jgi:hypothetical protein
MGGSFNEKNHPSLCALHTGGSGREWSHNKFKITNATFKHFSFYKFLAVYRHIVS